MTQTTATTHALRTVIELRRKILDGELEGGTRLFEVPLAEELAVSRTPLRDAMSRLAEEGLLDRARGGGFVVRRFTYSDIIDAIELRGVLEGTAARLAAERGVEPAAMAEIEATAAELDGCFGEAADEVRFEDYSRLNARFHRQLAALSRSDVVQREIERVCRLPFASPSAFLPDGARIGRFHRSLSSAHEQHRALLHAIAGREGFRAESIAREHARAARLNLEHAMKADGKAPDHLPDLARLVA